MAISRRSLFSFFGLGAAVAATGYECTFLVPDLRGKSLSSTSKVNEQARAAMAEASRWRDDAEMKIVFVGLPSHYRYRDETKQWPV